MFLEAVACVLAPGPVHPPNRIELFSSHLTLPHTLDFLTLLTLPCLPRLLQIRQPVLDNGEVALAPQPRTAAWLLMAKGRKQVDSSPSSYTVTPTPARTQPKLKTRAKSEVRAALSSVERAFVLQ